MDTESKTEKKTGFTLIKKNNNVTDFDSIVFFFLSFVIRKPNHYVQQRHLL
jgi:hypothetical protein